MTKQLLDIAFKSYPLKVLEIFILVLLNILFAGAAMGLILPIMEHLQGITPTHPLSRVFTDILTYLHLPVNLWVLVVTGLTLFALQALSQYLIASLAAKISFQVVAQLRVNLFSSLNHAPLGYFHRKKIGDVINGVIVEANRAGAAFRQLINTLVMVGVVMAFVLVAFLLSWKLSLLSFLVVGLLMYLTRQRQEFVRRGRKISHANDALHSGTAEGLLGIREVKVLGLEQHTEAIFAHMAKSVSSQNWLLERLSARFVFIYQMATVGIIFVLVTVTIFVLKTPVAEIVAFLAVLFRLAPMVSAFQKTRDKFFSLLAGFEVVNKLRREITQHPTRAVDGMKRDTLQSFIEFQNASFTYDGNAGQTLTNINLRFEQGKTTAIVGESGAGKSTLVDLIFGFYDLADGKILVDGFDLKQLDLVAWRRMIGFVSQDIFFFNDTVLKNIQYGNLEASEEEVLEAARCAHAHEFIAELPQGYHTVIGDRGVKLSGGQRQRLALARAILRDPKIIILDEATSDLDSKSEKLIQDSLKTLSKNRTVIIIAHRLSTIEHADEIVVLESGEVVEKGSHQTLLEKQQHYAEYYNIQFKENLRQKAAYEN